MRTGLVAGQQTPPSPVLDISGAGCRDSTGRFVARLGGRYKQVTLRAALHDDVTKDARVQVDLILDGTVRKSAVLASGSGEVLSADASRGESLLVRVKALSHTKSACTPNEYQVYLLDGLVQ